MSANYRHVSSELTDAERQALRAQEAEFGAELSIDGLLRSNTKPWYVLADARGAKARMSEVGGEGSNLGWAILAYGSSPAPWVHVGWIAIPSDAGHIDGSEFIRARLEARAAVHASAAVAGDVPRNVVTPGSRLSWTPSWLEVDGHQVRAQSASTPDTRIIFALTGSVAVFVHSCDWPFPVSLRCTPYPPDVRPWGEHSPTKP